MKIDQCCIQLISVFTLLVSAVQQPGYYKVVFDAHALSSGVYYYRLHAGDFVKVRKLLLMK
jgi:hypothetical protein